MVSLQVAWSRGCGDGRSVGWWCPARALANQEARALHLAELTPVISGLARDESSGLLEGVQIQFWTALDLLFLPKDHQKDAHL